MIANTLLTFYRVSTRHPRYALLNLVGLAFGIAVFITLGLFVHFETSFGAFFPDIDKVYEVGTRWVLPGRPISTELDSMSGLLEQLHEDFPDLVGTRIWGMRATLHKDGDVVLEDGEQIVDTDFFKLFDLPLLAGDKATALMPGKVMITEEMARKYFGRTDVIGESLRIVDEEGDKNYTVSAVLKNIPHNSDEKFDFVRVMTPALIAGRQYWYHWGSTSLETFVRFDTPAQADAFEAQLDAFANRKGGTVNGGQPRSTSETLRLVPFLERHLHDPKDAAAVVTLGLVGILAFIIAAINFVNLATARAGMRAREVAVRRTLGATQGSLRTQFLGEALIMTALALVVGLSLVELCLPAINTACGTDLTLDYKPYLAVLIGAILVMGLLSGLYPAFVLSAFQPAQILASSRSPSGGKLGMRVREALVVLQFSTVIVFFIMTIGFIRQLDHMKSEDLGFNREGLMIVPSTYDTAVTPEMRRGILAAFRAVPGVVSVTLSDAAPGDDTENDWEGIRKPSDPGQEVNIQDAETGPDFFQTYGARLLAGRFPDLAHGDGYIHDSPTLNVVLNAKAVADLGFASADAAIGQTLMTPNEHQQLQVIGVIDDLRFHTPKKSIPPEYFYFAETPHLSPVAGIRYEGAAEPEMRQRLEAAWRLAAPEVPLEIKSAADNLDKYYKPDRNRSHLFEIGALVAAAIGCIGLYGMAAFSTSRRMLEVAVRKVLGASRGAVVKLLVGQFMLPVLLANLLAWPIGYIALSNWLAQFSDRIAIGPLPFLSATGVALAVAVATVSALAFGSANAAPAKALRSE
jgi:putative ABC transport system permease protein